MQGLSDVEEKPSRQMLHVQCSMLNAMLLFSKVCESSLMVAPAALEKVCCRVAESVVTARLMWTRRWVATAEMAARCACEPGSWSEAYPIPMQCQ